MITKLFRRWKEPGLTSYLLGNYDGDGRQRFCEPQILHGDPNMFDSWFVNCNYSVKYLSGVLSWGESYESLDPLKVEQVVAECLNLICDEHPLSEFPHLVVLHRRNTGFDVHFGLGCEYLKKGRSFPFISSSEAHNMDGQILGLWRRKINLLNDWSDPDDPWRKRLTSPPGAYVKDAESKIITQINKENEAMFSEGFIYNRDDLVDIMRRDGHVVEKSPNYISVETSKKRSLQLHGALYQEDSDYAYLLSIVNMDKPPVRTNVDAEIGRINCKLDKRMPIRKKRLARFVKSSGFEFPERIKAYLGANKNLPGSEFPKVESTPVDSASGQVELPLPLSIQFKNKEVNQENKENGTDLIINELSSFINRVTENIRVGSDRNRIIFGTAEQIVDDWRGHTVRNLESAKEYFGDASESRKTSQLAGIKASEARAAALDSELEEYGKSQQLLADLIGQVENAVSVFVTSTENTLPIDTPNWPHAGGVMLPAPVPSLKPEIKSDDHSH